MYMYMYTMYGHVTAIPTFKSADSDTVHVHVYVHDMIIYMQCFIQRVECPGISHP